MTIGVALAAWLAEPAPATRRTGVQDLIGAGEAQRLYPVQLPQGLDAWPAATWQQISAERVWSHDGPSGLVAVRLQVDAWARDTAGGSGAVAAAALGEALRRALDGYRGEAGGVVFDRVALVDERDDYDPAVADRLWRVSQDYRVWAHEE